MYVKLHCNSHYFGELQLSEAASPNLPTTVLVRTSLGPSHPLKGKRKVTSVPFRLSVMCGKLMKSHLLCALSLSEDRSYVTLKYECSYQTLAQKFLSGYGALNIHDIPRLYYNTVMLPGGKRDG